MYDELVKRLREAAIRADSGNEISESLYRDILQAADAIEEQSAFARQMSELKKDGWYLQKTKMMTYGQATMTQPLPEPPKEETT